jgi:uncharacterized protein (TIGR02246 family)
MTQVATDQPVKDLLDQLVAAWDNQDADGYANLYTPDTVVATTGNVTNGRDKLRAFMTAGFNGPLKGTKSVEDIQQIRFITPDVAIVSAVSGFILPGETSVREAIARNATWVITHTEDGWKVASYHNSPTK